MPSLKLEPWLERLRALHITRLIARFAANKAGLSGDPTATWSIFRLPLLASPTDLQLADRTSAAIHPLFGELLGYYRPFNPISPIGIGDLLVVKQFLCGYELGEVAHIENVLLGENRRRKHRILDRVEDTLTEESEVTEDTTRELQTTERFELKAESDSTIQTDLNL